MGPKSARYTCARVAAAWARAGEPTRLLHIYNILCDDGHPFSIVPRANSCPWVSVCGIGIKTTMARCRLSRKLRERLIVGGLVIGSLLLALASNFLLA